MPAFTYTAVNRSGQPADGTVEAATTQQAIAQLTAQGLFATQVDSAASPATSAPATKKLASAPRARLALPWSRVRPRQRAAMLRHLAIALEAGLPLLAGIRVVHEQAETPALRDLLADLTSRVQSGQSLSDALQAHPTVFSPLHVSMTRAGETAGVLDQVMASLADFAERDVEVREKIRSASTYPLIVLTLAVASVIVILTFIIPRVLATVADTTAILPLPTRILMAGSDFLRQWWWLLLVAIAAAVWTFTRWLATPGGRLKFDTLKLRTPLLGPTLRKIAVGQFARTLGTLSRCGIQILEALHVLRDTLGNEALARTIDEVRRAITQGQSIAEPLRQTGQFPPLFIQVIALGERTGRLDELLLRAADSYEKETTAAVQRTMTVLPALFIVLLAMLVAFILAAVLLPIVNMQMAIPGG